MLLFESVFGSHLHRVAMLQIIFLLVLVGIWPC